jgi:hypothetical protein
MEIFLRKNEREKDYEPGIVLDTGKSIWGIKETRPPTLWCPYSREEYDLQRRKQIDDLS